MACAGQNTQRKVWRVKTAEEYAQEAVQLGGPIGTGSPKKKPDPNPEPGLPGAHRTCDIELSFLA